MSRLLGWLRDGWVIVGLTLLLVLVLDAALREWAGPEAWPRVSPGAEPPDRRAAPFYDDLPWAEAYWAEHRAARAMRWMPYAYWRREPHVGQAINVDQTGVRRTWSGSAGPQAPVVWVLGGSAVWGTGVTDDETVPSWLARLAAADAPWTVANLGESGYVTGQTLAYLQHQLRNQPPPDVILFLEGANDVFAALQAGRAGMPQNEENRVRDFGATDGIEHYLQAFPRALEGVRGFTAEAAPPVAIDALADEVVRIYRENARQARQIARAYGAAVVHAWQPTVFGRAQPSAFEQATIAAAYRDHQTLQRACDERIVGDADAIVLTQALDDLSETAFLDPLHLGPAANRRVAERLRVAVRAALGQPEPGASSTPGSEED